MSGSPVEVIEKRRTVPDLSGIDGSLRPLLEAMLQPDPADRPAGAASVADWLRTMAPTESGIVAENSDLATRIIAAAPDRRTQSGDHHGATGARIDRPDAAQLASRHAAAIVAVRFGPVAVRRRVAIRQCADLPAASCGAGAPEPATRKSGIGRYAIAGSVMLAAARGRGGCLHDRTDRLGRARAARRATAPPRTQPAPAGGQRRDSKPSACAVQRTSRRNGLAERSDRRGAHGDRQGAAG